MVENTTREEEDKVGRVARAMIIIDHKEAKRSCVMRCEYVIQGYTSSFGEGVKV